MFFCVIENGSILCAADFVADLKNEPVLFVLDAVARVVPGTDFVNGLAVRPETKTELKERYNKRNTAPLNWKIYEDIPCIITGDIASNRGRFFSLSLLDLFCALLCSIQ